MRILKLAAAFAMTAGIAGMAPTATCAYGGACNQCYGGCTDVYANDTAPGADTRYSHCLNSCFDENGVSCQAGAPG